MIGPRVNSQDSSQVRGSEEGVFVSSPPKNSRLAAPKGEKLAVAAAVSSRAQRHRLLAGPWSADMTEILR